MAERFFAFISRHPRGFDAVVAVFFTVFNFVDDAVWEYNAAEIAMLAPIVFVMGAALYWRRRLPVHVFVVNAVGLIVMTLVDVDSAVPASMLCATYSLAAYSVVRRHSLIALAGFVVAGFSSVLLTSPSYFDEALVVILALSLAWFVGDSLGTRRKFQQSVLERAERAEALRDSLAQQAVAEERTTIARDLHDVVAHSMSLMVVQAGAARRVAHQDLDASLAAMEAIETVGRNSLDEMRRILGVLRGDAALATAPQPDIAAIEPLADEFRAAGLPVEIRYGGDRRPLSPSLELTVFRIVQESLTNTLKHAGPARVMVQISFGETELHIVVDDNGRGNPNTNAQQPGSQKGHVGIRERVTSFDGTFVAKQRLSGGYLVDVTLPLVDGGAVPEKTRANNRSSQ